MFVNITDFTVIQFLVHQLSKPINGLAIFQFVVLIFDVEERPECCWISLDFLPPPNGTKSYPTCTLVTALSLKVVCNLLSFSCRSVEQKENYY